MLELNKIYHTEAINGMKLLDDNSIPFTLTSPPYDNIRKYKGFTFNFKGIADELYRITSPGGVIVWIVGDGTEKGGETGTSFKQALYFKEIGFTLHDTMIYHKSAFNFPANNRYHQVFEYMFVLTKGKLKTFNPIKDRKNIYVGQKAHGKHRGKDENDYKDMSKIVKAKPVGEYGQRTNVWYTKVGGGHVTKDKIAYKHPAIFPESLAEGHIKTWSNEGDIVFDPMAGSFTTGICAINLKRNFIGMDISKDYCEIGQQRFKNRFNFNIPIISI